MLSALLSGDQAGIADLSQQTPHQQAFSPLPSASGELIVDPGFVLPTTAGPLGWQLFYYNSPQAVANHDTWGYGRRASWPLRLSVIVGTGVLVEREDGTVTQYAGSSPAYFPTTPRIFDSLIHMDDGSWNETRFDTGDVYHYPAGNCVSLAYITTPQGRIITMNCDATHRLESIQEPAGRLVTYTYGSDGNVSSVEDWAGRIHTLQYASGNLIEVDDPAGFATTYGYDSSNRLNSITSPNNYQTTFSFDSKGRVLSRSVDSNIGVYTYTNTGSTVYTDPVGHIWTTTLNPYITVDQVIDPVGAVRLASYGVSGYPTSMTNAIGNTTHSTYDINGRMTSQTDPLGAITTQTFDTFGNLLTHQDSLGRTSTYQYDANGSTRLRISETDPLGHQTVHSYTNWGALLSTKTPMGFLTTYTWDNFGNRIAETNALGVTKTHQYDMASNRIVEIDEMGRMVTYGYDGMGRQTSSLNGVGAVRQTIYDGVGNVLVEVDPLGHRTSYQYNAYALVTTKTDALGNLWTSLYDAKGRISSQLDPLGNAITTIHDIADRKVGFVDGMGRITTTVYDLARQPIQSVDTTGLISTTMFDPVGRVIANVQASGLTATNIYDVAGQLIATQEPTGLLHTQSYDRAGRCMAMLEPTGAITTKLYDADGRQIATTDIFNRTASTLYDAIGQSVVSIDPAGRLLTTIYDPTGDRLQENHYDGTWVQHFYDAAARRVGTLDQLGNRTTTVYDLANREMAHQDEVGNIYQKQFTAIGRLAASVDELGNRMTTLYDAASRPVQYVDPRNNTTTLQYDASHALIQMVDVAGNPTNYHYDDFGRLWAVEDALGYRVSTIYDLAGRHQGAIDQAGFVTSIIFDDYGRWAATSNAEGSLFTVNFDRFNRVVGKTDALGYQATVTLDLLHRPIGWTDAKGFQTEAAYDVVHNIVKTVDACGYVTSHLYDGRGNRTNTIDAMGNWVTTLFDAFSRPVEYHNSLGDVVTTVFDNLSRVSTEVDPFGHSTVRLYDTNGRLYAQLDEAGNSTQTLYDRYGRYVATMDAQNQISTQLYDIYGRVLGYQDPLGYETQFSYDPLHRIATAWDELGNPTQYFYDARSNQQLIIDSLGRRTTSVYDPLNRVLYTLDSFGEGTANLYDQIDNIIAQQDIYGNITTYLYDGLGQCIASLDPFGNLNQVLYDGRNSIIAEIDAQGRITTHQYDPLIRHIGEVDAFGHHTQSVYDAAGRLIASINARGYTTSFQYDALGRQIAVEDPLGYRTSSLFDTRSNQIGAVDALGYTTTFVFDSLNRQIAQQNALGFVTTAVYDARGLQIASQDALGRLTTTVYDKLRRVQAQIAADGTISTLVYDSVSNQIAAIDPLGKIWTQLYDSRNRLSGRMDPLGRQHTMLYDNLNRLRSEQDALGQVTTRTYNANNQEIQRCYADGTLVTMAYNSLQQLVQVQDSTGITTMTYDLLNRLVTRNAPGHLHGHPLTYGYDENSNRTSLMTPWGLFQYGFDARDQIVAMSDPGSPTDGVSAGCATWTYDARKQSVRQDNPNGTFSTITYDPVMRTIQVRHSTHAGAEIDHAYLTYDAVGRPLVKDTINARHTFGYDAVDRLLSEQAIGGSINLNTSFVYDAAGRRIGVYSAGVLTPYIYDVADQLLSIGNGSAPAILAINCGGSAASPFVSDVYCLSGTIATTGATIDLTGVTDPAPMAVYQSLRFGSPYYVIPNFTPGATYTVRLHFAEINYSSVGARVFDILLNGTTVLSNFDIIAAAGSKFKAVIKEFTTIADGSGNIALSFSSVTDYPQINGIEILSVNGIDINCGGSAASPFVADVDFSGGSTYSVSSTIDLTGVTDPAAMAVYQTQRYATSGALFSYMIPDLTPRASYTVRLHFAEVYFSSAGERVFDVALNGTTILTSFDIFAAAGAANKALVVEAIAVADGSGNLTLTFSSLINNAQINGIQVFRNAQSQYLYDPNGSRLSATRPEGAVTTYIWDAANRLRSVQLPTGDIATQTYRYDDLRVSQQSSSGMETWTWDGKDVLNWAGPSNPSGGITTATNLMVQGPNLVRSVGADINGSALARQFHLDNQGSVQALTGSSASVEQEYGLDAWGNELTTTTSDNRSVYLGGLGYWQEPALGLNYVRARWMDPLTGQWLSVDPVPTEPRYLYVSNSPTMRTDPSGTQDVDISDIFYNVPGALGDFAGSFYDWSVSSFSRIYGNPQKARQDLKNASKQAGKVSRNDVNTFIRGLKNLGIYNLAQDFWIWLRKHAIPQIFSDLLPDKIEQFPQYAEAFVTAVVQSVIDMLIPIEAINQLITIFKVLSDPSKNRMAIIWDILKSMFGQTAHLLFGKHKSATQRGHDAGTIFVSVVQLILFIMGFWKGFTAFTAEIDAGTVDNILEGIAAEERFAGKAGTVRSGVSEVQIGRRNEADLRERYFRNAIRRKRQEVIGTAEERLTSGPSGAKVHVDFSTTELHQKYEYFASLAHGAQDVNKITANTHLPAYVIREVREHVFMRRHTVIIGRRGELFGGKKMVVEGYTVTGRFVPIEQMASLWELALKKDLVTYPTLANKTLLGQFTYLMAHEYIEAKLMARGIPYDFSKVRYVEDLIHESPVSGSTLSAHYLSPHVHHGTFDHWSDYFGKEYTGPKLQDNLSNIDDVVNYITHTFPPESRIP